MHKEAKQFVKRILEGAEVKDKSVMEVGSYDFNGSIRNTVAQFDPGSYIGTDILEGPGVDEVCAAENLVERFGENQFDIIVSTEMMEHARDWRGAASNMKRILKPGGVLALTTRSIGFMYHGYPYDFWRYQVEDMQMIFDDCEVIDIIPDTSNRAGVFVGIRKPLDFQERSLDDIALYSILLSRRIVDLSPQQEQSALRMMKIKLPAYRLWGRLPASIRQTIKKTLKPTKTV